MDIVDRLNDAINRFYGKEPAGLLQEAKDDLKWLNKKHAELIDDNERLRQLNAELVAVIEESIDPESIEPVGTQVWLDKVYDLLDRATGGE